jgi:hypothetical protein
MIDCVHKCLIEFTASLPDCFCYCMYSNRNCILTCHGEGMIHPFDFLHVLHSVNGRMIHMYITMSTSVNLHEIQ